MIYALFLREIGFLTFVIDVLTLSTIYNRASRRTFYACVVSIHLWLGNTSVLHSTALGVLEVVALRAVVERLAAVARCAVVVMVNTVTLELHTAILGQQANTCKSFSKRFVSKHL